MDAELAQPEIVSMATRTLLAAAYVISGVHRQPSHIEFKCERVTRLGAVIQFLIAITAKSVFSPEEVADITHAAANQNRTPVLLLLSIGPEKVSCSLLSASIAAFFSEGHPSSPVSKTPSGECNVITNRQFGEAWGSRLLSALSF